MDKQKLTYQKREALRLKKKRSKDFPAFYLQEFFAYAQKNFPTIAENFNAQQKGSEEETSTSTSPQQKASTSPQQNAFVPPENNLNDPLMIGSLLEDIPQDFITMDNVDFDEILNAFDV